MSTKWGEQAFRLMAKARKSTKKHEKGLFVNFVFFVDPDFFE